MGKYFTPWEAAADVVGSTITGWTTRGSATPTAVPAYGTPPIKRRYLDFRPTSTADHACVTWDVLDSDANRATFNLLTLVIFPTATATVHEVYARVQGSAPPTDYVRTKALYSGGNLTISIEHRIASAAVVSLASTGLGAWGASTSYWLRFTGSGGTVTATAWAVGTAEPSTPTVSTTTTVTAAGAIGLGGFGNGLICAFNFLAVGTNGDTATAPRTNTEFATWAASPSAKRCITAEMQATGYDSSGSPYTKTVKAYISTHGFTSKAQDTPATRHFDAHIAGVPTFSREMSNALFGQASVGFGDLVVRNPGMRGRIPGGFGVSFDGSNDVIDFGAGASITSGLTGDMTIEGTFVVNAFGASAAQTVLVSGRRTEVNQSFDLSVYGNLVQTQIHGAGGWQTIFVSQTGLIPLGVPVHIAISRTGTSVDFYVNGVKIGATQTVTVGALDAGNGVLMGKYFYGGAAYTNYQADEVRIWNVGRTAAQIAGYMGKRATGSETGLVACWHFDEGFGTTTADVSGNTNTGTFGASTAAPTWIAGFAMLYDNAIKGKLDAWLRMKWSRNYLVMKLGDPSWPYHDFRTIVYGRLGQPTAPSQGLIKFPIADLSDFFNKRVTSTRFSSGDYINQYKPKLLGYARAIEPPGDRATLVYTLNDGALLSSLNGKRRDSVFDYTGLALVHVGTAVDVLSVASVNAGTDTITASANHGMLAGYRLMFKELSTPPGGLFADVNYWVLAAGLTATDFKLTATQGSTTPVDITSTTTGAKFTGYGYTYDTSAGTVTLVASPAGRVIVFAASDTLFDVDGAYPARIIEEIAFTSAALSLNFKDATSFAAAVNVDLTYTAFAGLWYPAGNPPTCLDALNDLCNGTRAWYGFALDGLLQTGCVSLPAASAVKSLTTSDLKPDSLRLTDRRRAVDYSKTVDTYGPWFLTGAPTPAVAWVGGTLISDGSPQEAAQGKRTMAAYSYGAASTPIDNYPISIDAVSVGGNDTLLQTNAAFEARYVNVDKYDLGIFECQCRLGAIFHANGPLSIGDTISLEAPRLGWKQWTASDPASPDNTATIDSRLAVVKGIAVNLSGDDPFPVKLTLYRRIPGYYPTTDVN